MNEKFSIRTLDVNDWKTFKDVRLESLKLHPGVYGSRHDDEAAFADQQWMDRLSNPKGRIFGLFDEAELIGLNAVFTDRDDSSGKTASLVMWYLKGDYNGRGLFAPLVRSGIDWIRAQGHFEKICVNHRGGNMACQKNILKAGFTHVGTDKWVWPDGVEADYCMYEMKV